MRRWLSRLFRSNRTTRRPVQLRVEALEDRLTPAVTSLADGVLTINFDAVDESVSVSNGGANIDVSSSAAITGAGGTFATSDVTRIVLTDSGELAGQFVEFDGGFTLSAGLSSTGVETVSFNSAIDVSGGTMGIVVNAPQSILVTAALTTSAGPITLSANQQMTPTSGIFTGINVNAGTIQTTGVGAISLSGRGGASGSARLGIQLQGGAVLTSTATGADAGTITLNGTGGAATANNFGVSISGTGTQITSVDGDIHITGCGGGDGSAINNYGVMLGSAAVVSSTGTGVNAATITFNGTGGTGTNGNTGVVIQGASTLLTSVAGNIQITGQGGAASGNGNSGVSVTAAAVVSITGSEDVGATISITGTGGSGVNGNSGVRITNANSTVSIVTGTIVIEGTAPAGSNTAIELLNANAVSVTASGVVLLTGDSMNFGATNAVAIGANELTLRRQTDGTIDIGGADAAGTLGLTNAELNNIMAGTIHIGDDDPGVSTITVSAPITFNNPDGDGPNLTLDTGGIINLNATFDTDGGDLLFNGATINVLAGLTLTTNTSGTATFTNGTLEVGASPGAVTVGGTLAFTSTLTYHAEINGPTAGTDHDQITTNNIVTLGNAVLDLDFTITPTVGQSFVLIDNQNDGPITDTFAGLPEGALFVEAGLVFQITYRGDSVDDNSVVVTRVTVSPNLVVDNTGDGSDGNFSAGQLTLREAIELANLLDDANTVTFAPALSGATITLGGTQLPDLTGDVTITGPGANLLTVDANQMSRHFTVNAGVTAELSGLALVGGNDGDDNGGSILNQGTLTLKGCVLSNNVSGVSGGAISNFFAMSLTLEACSVNGNFSTGSGGGLDLQSDAIVTVTGSTFSDNHTAETGGGGAIYITDGALMLTNSTLSGNSGNGGGGLFINGGSVTVSHATITGNFTTTNPGGGISNFGNLTLTSSIVAGNTQTGVGASDINETVTDDGGFNLIGAAASSGGLTNGNNGNLVGVDPLLGPLADNGGPTQTHALLPGSPAIDAGGPAGPDGTDQRGFVRPFDVAGVANASDGRDIGAFEAQSLSLVVDENTDIDDGDFSDNHLSLREAINLANANPGADTITFDLPAQSTITLGGSQLQLTQTGADNKTTIQGPGAGQLAISGNMASRVFFIDLNVSAELSGLTITGGNGTGGSVTGGGGIYSRGLLSILDSAIVGNDSGSRNGGGLRATEGVATIRNSTFSGNRASSGGGVDSGSSAELLISNSTFSDNRATSSGGGGLNAASEKATVTNSTFSGNRATGDGGGIRNNFNLTIRSSTITGNYADSDDNSDFGGGIETGSGVTMFNTIVAGNFRGSAGTTPDDVAQPLAPTSSNNLIGDANSAGGLMDGNNGNIVGVNGVGTRAIDTVLNTMLAFNGGTTQTHALVTGSAAIDAGDNAQALDPLGALLTTDQRGMGFDRVNGAQVDIGAFESDAVFTDDFDGPDGSDLGDDYTQLNGRFTLVNSQAVAQGNKPAHATVDGVSLADVSLEADVNLAGNGSRAGLIARYTPKQGNRSESYYWARLINRNGRVFAQILKYRNGKVTTLASRRTDFSGNEHLRFEVVGNAQKLFVNGDLVVSANDTSLTGPGQVGIRARKGSMIDNLEVNPLTAMSGLLQSRRTGKQR